jgi:hypothetical protein
MARTFLLFGPHAFAGLVLLLLAAPGIAQTGGTLSYNTAILGRGNSTLPAYGKAAPYTSTGPALVGGGNVPPSLSSCPYSLSTIPGRYTPSCCTNYYPPYTYVPPTGPTLMCLASLTSTQGQYWRQIDVSGHPRAQMWPVLLDTRSKKSDLELWYKSVRPTVAKTRAGEKERAVDLDLARNHAHHSDIRSGWALNILLRSILASPTPTRGPNIPLEASTLKGLNLADMTTRGNLVMARDNGKIDWPTGLQEAGFDETRDRFTKNFDRAIKTVREGETPPVPLVRDLHTDLKALKDKLNDALDDLSPSCYIESRRLLNKFEYTVKGLSNARICKACNASWRKNIRTVSDLVAYCMKNDLEFAPAAAPGDEPCYAAAYQALRNYERETVLKASR